MKRTWLDFIDEWKMDKGSKGLFGTIIMILLFMIFFGASFYVMVDSLS